MEKHRIIKQSWAYEICENCGHNPKEIKMVKHHLVSGDPEGKYKSKKEMWICPRCGSTRRL